MSMWCRIAPAFLLALTSAPAMTAEPVTPPPMYPPETWEGRSAAIVRVLDKLDAHVETLTIPAGQQASYKSLDVAVRNCLQHAPGLPTDSASFLTIRDGHASTKPFEGWTYSAEPFVTVFESPVYGVQLVSCDGVGVAPAAPPLMPLPPDLPASIVPPAAGGPADTGPDPVYPSGAPDASAPDRSVADPAAPAAPPGLSRMQP